MTCLADSHMSPFIYLLFFSSRLTVPTFTCPGPRQRLGSGVGLMTYFDVSLKKGSGRNGTKIGRFGTAPSGRRDVGPPRIPL